MHYRKKASIVIPFLNAERTLRRCLLSVVNQSYQNWECILLNDGSTDRSVAVVDEFLSDKRFIYHNNNINLGVSTSRNIGIRISQGDFIFVLDADDEITSTRINNTIEILLNYPRVGIIGGKSLPSNSLKQGLGEGTHVTTVRTNPYQVKTSSLAFGCPYVHSTVAYRRELFFSPYHLSYNPSLLVAHDYDLYLQISSTNFLLAITESEFCIRHETGNGLMDRMSSRMIQESLDVKARVISAILPNLSRNLALAVSLLLTYNRFASQEQRLLCSDFIESTYVKQTLDSDTFERIVSRYNNLCDASDP